MTSSPTIPDGRIGVIAGNGRFPIIFADNTRKMGVQVYAVAHEGETEYGMGTASPHAEL